MDKAIDFTPNLQKLPPDTYWGSSGLPHSVNTLFKKDKFVLGANTFLIGGILPVAFLVALTGLEIVIAFLQAYVFAILTCLYINDAIHLH